MTGPCGVVVVDDAIELREMLVLALGRDPRLQILADVGDGQQAIDAVAQHRPHVVLMDIAMPVMDGITATRTLKMEYPHLGVVIFTGYADERVATEATKTGADAFIDKSSPLTQLADLLIDVGGCG